jgi:hypothetical protein
VRADILGFLGFLKFLKIITIVRELTEECKQFRGENFKDVRGHDIISSTTITTLTPTTPQ